MVPHRVPFLPHESGATGSLAYCRVMYARDCTRKPERASSLTEKPLKWLPTDDRIGEHFSVGMFENTATGDPAGQTRYRHREVCQDIT